VSDDMRKPSYDSAAQVAFLEKIHAHFGCETITLKQLNEYVDDNSIDSFPYFILRERKIARNTFSIVPTVTASPKPAVAAAQTAPMAMAATVVNLTPKRAQNTTESFVPNKLSTYVPFGFFNDLKNVIASKAFYPMYITGLSGNGKTLMVEQVCASLKRELIRVNITKRTDETDLIGSYELIDGNTVRREGPVITAMRRGAVLLLDETDYGTEDLLCLNGVLEGKPYFDKKTGEVIHPAEGFNIIATANTKGKGSDDGRFIGANVLNEAFLERFAITVEQEYPSMAVERNILVKNFAELGLTDADFIKKLVLWADIVRKGFQDGFVSEVISTRRLVHIAKAYSIFNNRKKAIELCLNRFDTETKISFLDFYTKLDEKAVDETVDVKDTTSDVKDTTSDVKDTTSEDPPF